MKYPPVVQLCIVVVARILVVAAQGDGSEVGLPEGVLVKCANGDRGVRSLAALRQWQVAEFEAVQQGRSVRGPPYTYTLCRQSYYVSTEADVITPLLDKTVIRCRSPRRRCSITSSSTLPHVHLYKHDCNYTRWRTTFHRIQFEVTSTSTVSVAAWDTAETSVSFVDCIWKVGGGYGLIHNAVDGKVNNQHEVEDVVSVPSAMKVTLERCTIRGVSDKDVEDRLTFLVASIGGSINLENVLIDGNYVQVLFHGDSSSMWQVSESIIRDNWALDGFYLAGRSRLHLAEINFVGNFFLGTGTVVATRNSMVQMMNTYFEENRASSDLVLESGSEGQLDFVAFVNGRYTTSPTYMANDAVLATGSMILSNNPSGLVDPACPRGVYHAKDRDDPCLTFGICAKSNCKPFPTSSLSCADEFVYRYGGFSWPCYTMGNSTCQRLVRDFVAVGNDYYPFRRYLWFCPETCDFCPET